MSLINEMLQDLDSRKHLQTTEAVCDAEIAVPPDNSAGSRTAWIILGLLFLVFIGFWFVQTLVIGSEPAKPTPNGLAQSVAVDRENSATDAATAKAPVERPVAATTEINTENILKSIDNPPVESTSDTIVAVETEKPKTQTDVLLSAAEAALNKNRLSLPRGESAYDLYRRVIAIDPNNTGALAGLEKIKTRYADLIEDALAAAEFERAAQLVGRVGNLSLTFDVSQLDDYRDRIQEQQHAAETRATKKSEPESLAADNPNSADTYLAINKTTVSRELALAREVQQLFAQGRGREAAKQLENFIDDNIRADLSRISLFDYYLGQTQISQARELMEPEHVLSAATLAYMQAKMAMMSSGAAAAIAMLEKQKPEKNITEIYNTLLAGLYQKEKAHGKAVALYASLIEINPSNVTYWLGMGISRDALGEQQHALSAYNVVLAHKNLDANVRNFVTTRIQVLSSRVLSSRELAEAAW